MAYVIHLCTLDLVSAISGYRHLILFKTCFIWVNEKIYGMLEVVYLVLALQW
jgi:hypothetical protein